MTQRGTVDRRNSLGARRPVPSRRRELRDVRHSSWPDLRVERVTVAPSGIHVVTTTATPVSSSSRAELAHARAAADLVAALLPRRYRRHVRGVLCHVDEPGADSADGILVTSPQTLEHVVQFSPVVLSTSEVHQVHLRLEAVMEPFPVAAPTRLRGRWRRRLAVAGLVAASSATAAALLAPELSGALPSW